MSDDPQRIAEWAAAIRADQTRFTVDAAIRLADTEQEGLRAALRFKDGTIEDLAAEIETLRATVARAESVCMNTDGDYLDGDCEIPVGEVLRMIHGDTHPALGLS